MPNLNRISFITGFSAGFVAGARSGRQTYDQIAKYAQQAWEHPTVQQARGSVQNQASSMGSQIADKMPQMAQNAAKSAGGKIPGMRPNKGNSGSGQSTPTTTTTTTTHVNPSPEPYVTSGTRAGSGGNINTGGTGGTGGYGYGGRNGTDYNRGTGSDYNRGTGSDYNR